MTDKLNGIKPGDRVRVTFEAIAHIENGDPQSLGIASITYDGRSTVVIREGVTWISLGTQVSDPTFQITRIEPDMAVGDMVTYWGSEWEIVAIKGRKAVLWSDALNDSSNTPLSELTRVPAK